jgi:hypothetical protein
LLLEERKVLMPPGDFRLFRNNTIVDLATSNTTSQVGEPSVANNGRFIFFSGNWYGSLSLDSGATFRYVNPYTKFPRVNGGFCCDQVVLYDLSRDLLFWLLQYVEDGTRNTLRLAIARGDTLATNTWYYYDFTPDGVNAAWTRQWFDYPDLALSSNFLYLTSNMFRLSGGWTRAVILRVSLDELAAGAGLTYNYYASTTHGSFRVTQGARDTAYWGAHTNLSSLRVFSWPENTTTVTWNDVAVTPWSDAVRAAPGPDGRDWCGRADGRITAAWVAKGVIGFMWSAAQNPPTRPYPYVRVVRINEATKTLIAEPDLWNRNFAYCYPATAPNDRGDLGLSVFYGGGTVHPSHAVGIDDDFTPGVGWSLVTTRAGTNGPDRNRWGDYLAVRRHAPDGLTWVATGYTQQGGSAGTDIEPRFVHFGRRRDEPAVIRWQNA